MNNTENDAEPSKAVTALTTDAPAPVPPATARDAQRSALAELMDLIKACAAAEARIELEKTQKTETVEKDLDRARLQADHYLTTHSQDAVKQHDQKLHDAKLRHESDMANAAEADRMAALLVIAQKRLDLHAELDAMLFELADAERMLRLLGTSILPKARQALELIQGDFSAGRAGLTDVISAWQAWLGGELSLIRARAEALKSRAAVESLTGLALKDEP